AVASVLAGGSARAYIAHGRPLGGIGDLGDGLRHQTRGAPRASYADAVSAARRASAVVTLARSASATCSIPAAVATAPRSSPDGGSRIIVSNGGGSASAAHNTTACGAANADADVGVRVDTSN